MNVHDVCKIFPLMSGKDFEDLKADIAAHGQVEGILTYKDKVIDGRNRMRACEELGIEPWFLEWDGKGSLVDMVVSLNLHRRHLTPSDRGVIGIEIKKQKTVEAKERQKEHAGTAPGRGKETLGERIPQVINGDDKVMATLPEPSRGPRARDEAAKLAGVNPRYIDMAEKLEKRAPEIFEEVKNGTLNLPQAMHKAFPKPAGLEPKKRDEKLTIFERIRDDTLALSSSIYHDGGWKNFSSFWSLKQKERTSRALQEYSDKLIEWKKELDIVIGEEKCNDHTSN